MAAAPQVDVYALGMLMYELLTVRLLAAPGSVAKKVRWGACALRLRRHGRCSLG